MKNLTILDRKLNKHVDLFHLVLLLDDELSLLPEIYEVFGDQALTFIDMFAGATVRIPSPEQLEKSAQKVDIYLAVTQADDKDKRNTIRDLAQRYDISEHMVEKAHQDVSDYIRDRYRVVPVSSL